MPRTITEWHEALTAGDVTVTRETIEAILRDWQSQRAELAHVVHRIEWVRDHEDACGCPACETIRWTQAQYP